MPHPQTRRALLAGAARLAAAVPAALALPAGAAANSDADAELLALFSCWVENTRALDRPPMLDLDDDEFALFLRARDDIADRIAATPAATATGLAIQGYLLVRAFYGATQGDEAGIDPPPDDLACFEGVLARNFIAGARRLLPALGCVA